MKRVLSAAGLTVALLIGASGALLPGAARAQSAHAIRSHAAHRVQSHTGRYGNRAASGATRTCPHMGTHH